jgi:predicted HNH restriction endonuclease
MRSPLEIHHKDGSKKNNSEDNLDLLCPNCHSLTFNYNLATSSHNQYTRKHSIAEVDDRKLK